MKRLAIVDVVIYMLAEKKPLRLAEVKANTVSDTLDHVKGKALGNKFATTLAEMKAKTTGGILRDVEVEAIVDKTADTLQEVRVKIVTAY